MKFEPVPVIRPISDRINGVPLFSKSYIPKLVAFPLPALTLTWKEASSILLPLTDFCGESPLISLARWELETTTHVTKIFIVEHSGTVFQLEYY